MGHLLTGGPVGGLNILDSFSSEVQEVKRVLLTTPDAFFPMSDFTHNSNFMDPSFFNTSTVYLPLCRYVKQLYSQLYVALL